MGKKSAPAPKERKIPERQCLGCGEHRPKSELVRIVRSPDGTISIDRSGKKPGRGAYVCPARACLRKLIKSRRAEQNLGCEIPDGVWQTLEDELEAAE